MAVELTALPEVSRIDQPVRLAASGLVAGSLATLRVRTRDASSREWESWAAFRADASGTVDASAHAPESGSYSGVDAFGLLWSMTPVEPTRPVFFMGRGLESLSMTLSVSVDGSELAGTAFTRTFADPGLAETSFDGRGALFRPDVAGDVPGVLVLGGSDGGRHDHAAALLASNGYAALALTYFGAENTPSHLHRIELRTFDTALDWLAAQPGVDGDRLAVIGLSRGGELALQLAALYPRIRAVVAAAPSSVRQAGLTSSYTDFTQPAWVLDGEPLPFVPGKFGPREVLGSIATWIRRRPTRQLDMFRRQLHGDQDVVRQATIEVERFAGRMLLVSGVDDQLWPSAEYAELIVRRLRDHGREARHLSYPDAGHFVCFPYGLPSLPPFVRLAPYPGFTVDFGGTPAANAAAARRSWSEILSFLAEAV